MLSVLAALLAALLAAPCAIAEEPEVLLLAVRVDREPVSDGVEALVVDGDVRLPVRELARLLELDDSVVAFDAARMTATQDDVLAGAALFAEWFAVEVKVDRHASMVTLHPAAPLPFQLRRKREAAAAALQLGRGQGDPSLPLLPNRYAMLNVPFVDARLRSTASQRAASLDYDLFATGDVAGLSATAFIAGSNARPLTKSWLTLGRRDPEPVLLGPLHARELALGEVWFPGNDLVAAPKRGTGAVLSSFPLARPSRFDEQTLSGDIRPGEDVELYVNGTLSGYVRGADSGGHYTFSDVPVLYGLNVFRLVFYDARGRQRIETRTFNAGDTLTRKGELDYRVVTAGRQLAEVSYGVTRALTVTGAATSLSLDGERRNYVSAGGRAAFGRVFGYADVARDLGGGTIGRAGLQMRAGPVGLSFARSQLDRFVSESYDLRHGPIAARTSLQAGGAFGSRHVVPMRLDVTVEELVSGGRITRLGATISTALGRLLVANAVQGRWSRNVPAGEDSTSSGTLRFSRVSGEVALRGDIAYGISPRRELRSASIAADWRHFRSIDLRGAVECNLATRISRATATIRRDAGRYDVGVTVEVPSRGGPVMRVELATSVLHHPVARRWNLRSQASAASGAVAAIVFLDDNANGTRDDGEAPVAGAGFVVNRGASPVLTDAGGVAFLDRLPPDRRHEIGVATATLEDPGWVPATAGTSFVARAGKPLVVHFPIVVTGEITGTVSRGGRTVSAVRVQLLRADGSTAAETFTAYDGFYVLGGVKPGTYGIRVAGQPESRTLTVSSEEHLFDNIDFILTDKNS